MVISNRSWRRRSVYLSLAKNVILSHPLVILPTTWKKPVLVEGDEVSTLVEAELRDERRESPDRISVLAETHQMAEAHFPPFHVL